MITALFDRCIALYQRTLSPDHGIFSHHFPYGFCRFTPSCSQYARESIARRGVFKGTFFAFWRIVRCNPFSASRYDPAQ